MRHVVAKLDTLARARGGETVAGELLNILSASEPN
jgi:hypothetical protein